MNQYLIFISSFIGLIFSSWLFTENIERGIGSSRFGTSFLGSIIAPFFTSLPELAVILISMVDLSYNDSSQVVSGVTLGEPFAALSLGFFIFSLFTFNKIGKNLRDFRNGSVFVFIALSSLSIILASLYQEIKTIVAVFLVLAYILFIYSSYLQESPKNTEDQEKALESKRKSPIAILLAGVVILLISSYFLTKSIAFIATELGVSPYIISLLVIPLGTILPELSNSVIWGRKGKIDLALGNLSGEVVIFITIYPALTIISGKFLFSSGSTTVLALIVLNSAFNYMLWKLWKGKPFLLLMDVVFFIIYLLYYVRIPFF